jgi:hypothetical protein
LAGRWLKRHSELMVIKEKPIEGERRRAQDQENIRQFLEKYIKTVDKYNIKS